MAAMEGKCFTPHQWDKHMSAVAYYQDGAKWNMYTLPDITIWSAPGEHHELKHKNATRAGQYGLEVYRFEALLSFGATTRQKILYTIHDHDMAGGKNVRKNNPFHWVTAQIGAELRYDNSKQSRGNSWVNGEKTEVDILYWRTNVFSNLMDIWRNLQTDLFSLDKANSQVKPTP